MKRYFVTSDIHGFYNEFISALNRAGFDNDNPEHILIICGDIFDRGSQPLELYKFLKRFPEERRILIRGNHEFLLKDLVERKYCENHDLHNGTFDTLAYIAKKPKFEDFRTDLNYKKYFENKPNIDITKEIRKYNNSLYNNKKIKEIINWIFSDEWVNYYELTNYIFVHSWIPTNSNSMDKEVLLGMLPVEETYDPDWRTRSIEYWEEAVWPCPWKQYNKGLNKTGKVIVCGHWHTSDFWNNLVYKDEPDKKLNLYTDNPIFRKEGINLIGLDACTAATRGINILTISEDELHLGFYDHNSQEESNE